MNGDEFDALEREEPVPPVARIEIMPRPPEHGLTRMDLCQSFRHLAFGVSSKLSLARQVRVQPGEEGITDDLLIELRRRHPTEILTRTFSKQEEGVVGADWEWWFVGIGGHAMGFRVQAKIINLESACFEHLHYRTREGRYQCDRLIEAALKSTSATLPMYCLYTAGSDDLQRERDIHRRWQWGSYPYASESYGCSVTSAFDIRALRLEGHINDLGHLFPVLHPWHCLVCCSGLGRTDLARRVRMFWRRAVQAGELTAGTGVDPEAETDDPTGYWSELSSIAKRVGFSQQIPGHVSAVIEDMPSQPTDDLLGGIVIFREREQ